MTSRSPDFRSPLARLSRVNLYKPRDNKGKLKYEANLIFPKDTDLTDIKEAVKAAAVAEWGDKAAESLKKGLIKIPVLDGDGPQGMSKKTEERYPELEGMYFIRCASNHQPALFSRKMGQAQEGSDLYSGCYGYAVLHAYTWESAENGKGVSLGLSMVQMVKDGPKLGGAAADPSKFFEKIEDTGDATDTGDEGAGALFS